MWSKKLTHTRKMISQVHSKQRVGGYGSLHYCYVNKNGKPVRADLRIFIHVKHEKSPARNCRVHAEEYARENHTRETAEDTSKNENNGRARFYARERLALSELNAERKCARGEPCS